MSQKNHIDYLNFRIVRTTNYGFLADGKRLHGSHGHYLMSKTRILLQKLPQVSFHLCQLFLKG
ncbi:hypothetical protein Hanom_Chr10g00951711 [Helianthus anomalus]